MKHSVVCIDICFVNTRFFFFSPYQELHLMFQIQTFLSCSLIRKYGNIENPFSIFVAAFDVSELIFLVL